MVDFYDVLIHTHGKRMVIVRIKVALKLVLQIKLSDSERILPYLTNRFSAKVILLQPPGFTA